MKKSFIVTGALAAAFVFVPGSVSANSYQSEDNSKEYAHSSTWRPDDLNCDYDNEYGDGHSDNSQTQVDGTIADVVTSDNNFTTLAAAVQAAGLGETLSAAGDLTVFAPTDEAFAKLPAGTVEALLADKTALTNVLTNHVVSGRLNIDEAVEAEEVVSLAGNNLNVYYDDDDVLYVNDSVITVTDIMTSNGIIHVIDAVLVPEM